MEYMRSWGGPQQGQVYPEFYMDTVRNDLASVQAGREIFAEEERIRIIIPGAVASMVVKRVDDTHRQRWPEAYAAFRAGREAPIEGIPLEEWPILNRSQVAELRHLKIRTIEQLAGLSDVHLQAVGMGGRMLRDRAKAYLEEAGYEAFTTQIVHENDLLRTRIVTLENQVTELGRQLLILTQQRQDPAAPHPYQTYVPGRDDPFERQHQAPPPAASSLDSFAAMAPAPPRRRLPGPPAAVNFDPAQAEPAAEELGPGFGPHPADLAVPMPPAEEGPPPVFERYEPPPPLPAA